VDVRILLPGYTPALKASPALKTAATVAGLPGEPDVNLLQGVLPDGVPFWMIDCPEMYQRGGGIYQDEHGEDWPDNALRFGLLSKVAALLGSAATPLSWKPDVVHCNDWQSALTPAYLHYAKGAAPCVMTVHNLAFQGVFPSEVLPDLGLPWDCFQPDGVEFYGKLSFLKAGLYYARHITTVSPSYAEEIQHDELGFGLQGLLESRRDSLSGILNGIDTVEWNPSADKYITAPYDAQNLAGKAANKRALQQHMGLLPDTDIPLLGLVSRFTHQKGLDVVLDIAPQLLAMPVQLVFLGSGDAEMQRRVLELAHHHPGQVGAYVGFDEGLSHQIEAGADIFLMPSRFEPCGLNQMYSQRYGTPPLVHATGGLKDSVVDCTPATLARGEASGFVFAEMSAQALSHAVQRAVAAFRDKATWLAVQRNGMARDFGWQNSASAYLKIYSGLLA
ncbi:MAG TPA: glycogen synthase GlgA, partial [Gallionellaceae bacterium]|nr:glycogen synthase GlgA [Gallionellaceae bacterium]